MPLGQAPQSVNFWGAMNPDVSQQQAGLQQQQMIAQQMMAEGAQPINPLRSSGRFIVPISGMEAAGHSGKMIASAMMQRSVNEQQSKLANQQMQSLIGLLRGGQQGPQQVASAQGATDSPQGLSDQSAASVGAPGAASSQLPQPPQQQASINQAPGAMGQRSPLSLTGDANKDIGLMMAGQLFGPAYGAALMKQQEPTDFQKDLASGAQYGVDPRSAYTHKFNPLIQNRGFGLGSIGPNGEYKPDPASLEQALAMEKGKAAISSQYAPPHKLPLSEGQEASVFPAEQPDIIKTGNLPSRFGPVQGQLPPQVPQADAAAYTAVRNAAMSGGTGRAYGNGPNTLSGAPVFEPKRLGTVGLTQSQPDQIQQARQMAGGKAVDEAFAKDYVSFSTGGGASDAAKQLGQLGDVVTALQDPKANLTGPYLGALPDRVKSFVNPNSIAMRERVEEVAQRSLRAVLGAQFTEREGERLIARAYNPSLPEKENAIRVQRLFTQLQQAFDTKQSAAKYFEANGTLEGWGGKLPSISDFDLDTTKSNIKSQTPQSMFAKNPTTGERITSNDGGKTWQPAR